MKFNLLNKFFCLFIVQALVFSCNSRSIEKKLPKVENAIYNIYDISGERGYLISFELDNNSVEPVGVVINKIEQGIPSDSRNGLAYKVNVISESRKINDFKPKKSKYENGIIFKMDDKYYMKPVKFQLK